MSQSRTFVCPVAECGRVIVGPLSDLATHVRAHGTFLSPDALSPLGLANCTFCGYAYAVASGLANHVNHCSSAPTPHATGDTIQSRSLDFPCPVTSCSVTPFATRRSLAVHLRLLHAFQTLPDSLLTPVGLVSCRGCLQPFVGRTGLRNHQNSCTHLQRIDPSAPPVTVTSSAPSLHHPSTPPAPIITSHTRSDSNGPSHGDCATGASIDCSDDNVDPSSLGGITVSNSSVAVNSSSNIASGSLGISRGSDGVVCRSGTSSSDISSSTNTSSSSGNSSNPDIVSNTFSGTSSSGSIDTSPPLVPSSSHPDHDTRFCVVCTEDLPPHRFPTWPCCGTRAVCHSCTDTIRSRPFTCDMASFDLDGSLPALSTRDPQCMFCRQTLPVSEYLRDSCAVCLSPLGSLHGQGPLNPTPCCSRSCHSQCLDSLSGSPCPFCVPDYCVVCNLGCSDPSCHVRRPGDHFSGSFQTCTDCSGDTRSTGLTRPWGCCHRVCPSHRSVQSCPLPFCRNQGSPDLSLLLPPGRSSPSTIPFQSLPRSVSTPLEVLTTFGYPAIARTCSCGHDCTLFECSHCGVRDAPSTALLPLIHLFIARRESPAAFLMVLHGSVNHGAIDSHSSLTTGCPRCNSLVTKHNLNRPACDMVHCALPECNFGFCFFCSTSISRSDADLPGHGPHFGPWRGPLSTRPRITNGWCPLRWSRTVVWLGSPALRLPRPRPPPSPPPVARLGSDAVCSSCSSRFTDVLCPSCEEACSACDCRFSCPCGHVASCNRCLGEEIFFPCPSCDRSSFRCNCSFFCYCGYSESPRPLNNRPALTVDVPAPAPCGIPAINRVRGRDSPLSADDDVTLSPPDIDPTTTGSPINYNSVSCPPPPFPPPSPIPREVEVPSAIDVDGDTHMSSTVSDTPAASPIPLAPNSSSEVGRLLSLLSPHVHSRAPQPTPATPIPSTDPDSAPVRGRASQRSSVRPHRSRGPLPTTRVPCPRPRDLKKIHILSYVPKSLWGKFQDVYRPILIEVNRAADARNLTRLHDLLVEFHDAINFVLHYSRGNGKSKRGRRRRDSDLSARMTNEAARLTASFDPNPPPSRPDSGEPVSTSTNPLRPPPTPSRTHTSRKVRRAVSLSSRNHLSRAVRSLYQSSLAETDPDTLRKLRDLHPSGPSDLPRLPDSSPVCPVLPDDHFTDLWKKKIATGGSAGVSGFSGEHGLPLLDDPDCLSGLARLIQLIRNGELGPQSRSFLLSCVLVGVPKKNNGVRPIAIGETLYKMASSHAISSVASETGDLLGSDQFALSSGGSESAVLVLKAALESLTGVSTDVRNAYNELCRRSLLQNLYSQRRLAPIFRLVDWAYHNPSDLFIFDKDGCLVDQILSSQGVRQGDPLASLLFCLSIKTAIDAAKLAGGPDVKAVAIMDDVTFLGPTDGDQVTKALRVFEQKLLLMGLQFQGQKSFFINFHGEPLSEDTLSFAREKGMEVNSNFCTLGGAPMGPDRPSVEASAIDIVSKSDTFFSALEHSEMTAPAADRLLRFCGIPRLNFLSRVGLLGEYHQALRLFDTHVSKASSDLVVSPDRDLCADQGGGDIIDSGGSDGVSPSCRSTLSSPLRFAGFAFRSYTDHIAPFAFWGAFAQAAPHLLRYLNGDLPPRFAASVTSTLTFLIPKVHPDVASRHLPPPGSDANFCLAFYGSNTVESLDRSADLQRILSRSSQRLDFTELLRGSAPGVKARLLACSAPYASSWLSDPLSEGLLSSHAYSAAGKLRLGLPLSPSTPPTCHCGADLRLDPWHVLVHKGRAQSIRRHDSIVKSLSDWVLKAGGQARVEPRQEYWHDNRRVDLRIVLGASIFLVDVAVVHPTSSTYLPLAVQSRLGAANAVARWKSSRYAPMAHHESASFIPFVVETFGGFCDQAISLMKSISSYADSNSPSLTKNEVLLGIRSSVQSCLFEGNLRIANEELMASFPRAYAIGRAQDWSNADSGNRSEVPSAEELGSSSSDVVRDTVNSFVSGGSSSSSHSGGVGFLHSGNCISSSSGRVSNGGGNGVLLSNSSPCLLGSNDRTSDSTLAGGRGTDSPHVVGGSDDDDGRSGASAGDRDGNRTRDCDPSNSSGIGIVSGVSSIGNRRNTGHGSSDTDVRGRCPTRSGNCGRRSRTRRRNRNSSRNRDSRGHTDRSNSNSNSRVRISSSGSLSNSSTHLSVDVDVSSTTRSVNLSHALIPVTISGNSTTEAQQNNSLPPFAHSTTSSTTTHTSPTFSPSCPSLTGCPFPSRCPTVLGIRPPVPTFSSCDSAVVDSSLHEQVDSDLREGRSRQVSTSSSSPSRRSVRPRSDLSSSPNLTCDSSPLRHPHPDWATQPGQVEDSLSTRRREHPSRSSRSHRGPRRRSSSVRPHNRPRQPRPQRNNRPARASRRSPRAPGWRR